MTIHGQSSICIFHSVQFTFLDWMFNEGNIAAGSIQPFSPRATLDFELRFYPFTGVMVIGSQVTLQDLQVLRVSLRRKVPFVYWKKMFSLKEESIKVSAEFIDEQKKKSLHKQGQKLGSESHVSSKCHIAARGPSVHPLLLLDSLMSTLFPRHGENITGKGQNQSFVWTLIAEWHLCQPCPQLILQSSTWFDKLQLFFTFVHFEINITIPATVDPFSNTPSNRESIYCTAGLWSTTLEECGSNSQS